MSSHMAFSEIAIVCAVETFFSVDQLTQNLGDNSLHTDLRRVEKAYA
jgi:hypothetical protein